MENLPHTVLMVTASSFPGRTSLPSPNTRRQDLLRENLHRYAKLLGAACSKEHPKLARPLSMSW